MPNKDEDIIEGPKAIRTKFLTVCDQTLAIIEEGELCIRYFKTGKTYHRDSPQGRKFFDDAHGRKKDHERYGNRAIQTA